MIVFRDLLRFSPSFRFGFFILLIVLVLLILSFVAPFAPNERRVVERNMPPSIQYLLGTTSQGQDVFWLLTYAVRNTLLIAGVAVIIGRSIAVVLGMFSGYVGGITDRILSSIVESLIVIPRLPLLILIASIMRGEMTVLILALLLGLLDWAPPSKRYRAQVLSLREYEFTNTAVFSGMSRFRIIMREHLPFLIPFLMADTVSGFLWAIGMEVTLSYLGLSDLSSPSIGTLIYWGNYYQSLLTNRIWVLAAPIGASVITVIGFYLISLGLREYLDPRTRLNRLQAKG